MEFYIIIPSQIPVKIIVMKVILLLNKEILIYVDNVPKILGPVKNVITILNFV